MNWMMRVLLLLKQLRSIEAEQNVRILCCWRRGEEGERGWEAQARSGSCDHWGTGLTVAAQRVAMLTVE